MQINTVVIIKHPLEPVWEAMQNQLSEIAFQVDDIESIQLQERQVSEASEVVITNVWKAKPMLPDFLKSMIQPDMLTWTDTAVWKTSSRTCHWVIHSHYFKEKMDCTGVTLFEPALGGRGCRLSVQGNLQWNGGTIGVLQQGIEAVIGNIIPANFRKLAHAVEGFLHG
ncbi:hypothetical protein [Haliscomenobacter hydrossis]|uniref:Cyclase/dehydrase n=1 Tax=Haliscomenobacter hydrossis (strain ATCC 27775 / DSM 1100 / LMG 10767 / O) TaxID=760192 RepID=F4L045_HALH1|nr:hypothetical protein [Haliscomenobacter hydrossis]AEE52754.1 hypothetical protein Halhy_4926 [Haliscomenobacter hydrossis DSM 1100]